MEENREFTDFAVESDSERRRKRRRRRTKKKEEMSAETGQILRLVRWGVGGLVMVGIWGYGLYVIDKFGWTAAIFFPLGIAAMLGVAAALSIPLTTFVVVIATFLLQIDSGPLIGLQCAGIAFLGVGFLYAVWRLFVFLIVKREVTRNEAGYK